MASQAISRRLSRRHFLKGVALTGVLAAATGLTGCQQLGIGPGAKITLQVWTDATFAPPSDDYQTEQIQAWAKQNGVDVEVTRETGDNIQKKLQAAAESKQFPDLSQASGARVTLFQKSGIYRSVDDLYSEFGKQWGGFYKPADQFVTIEGKKWSLPYSIDSSLILSRLDLLKKAELGPPKSGYTWDNLYETALKAHRPPEYYGVGFQFNKAGTDAESTFTMMLYSMGGSVVLEDSKTLNIKSPVTTQWLQYIVKTWEMGVYPPGVTGWDNASNNTALQDGKVVFINNPASPLVWARQNKPELLPSIGVSAMPAGPKGAFASAYVRDGWVLFKDTPERRQNLVISLMRHLYSRDVYRKWMELAFPAPAVAGMEDLAIWQNPQRAGFLEAAKNGVLDGWPGQPNPAQAELGTRTPVLATILRVIVDKWTVDRAIDEFDQVARDIYKKHFPDMKY